jgi:hypothetical protein
MVYFSKDFTRQLSEWHPETALTFASSITLHPSLAGKMAIKNHFIMTHLNTPVSNPLLRQKPIVRPPQSFSSSQIVGTDIEVCWKTGFANISKENKTLIMN